MKVNAESYLLDGRLFIKVELLALDEILELTLKSAPAIANSLGSAFQWISVFFKMTEGALPRKKILAVDSTFRLFYHCLNLASATYR